MRPPLRSSRVQLRTGKGFFFLGDGVGALTAPHRTAQTAQLERRLDASFQSVAKASSDSNEYGAVIIMHLSYVDVVREAPRRWRGSGRALCLRLAV